ncbi:hypothetical protein VNO78_34006 [Psophocarpus tetragonolobus]|uniref:Senescence-associated carboxylesterase 101-like n=1 Tax=Psophocarpus tetragonolobus TaxID=3891 RepID=A0AAN9P4S5_PSOTE
MAKSAASSFSSGIELGSFVTSSAVLCKSWEVIKSGYKDIIPYVGQGLSWKLYKEPDSGLAIVAFEVTQDSSTTFRGDLVSSNALREKNLHHFDFLCTKKAPDFFVNSTAISLFYENIQRLDELKSQIYSSSQLIVTGHGLGGPIASLFTITLFDGNDDPPPRKKQPLCITFGSPLVGDKKLKEAISRSSKWSSSFLHVVSYKDPVPKMLNPDTSDMNPLAYMPFGTFLFCSDTNSTSFENPESVLELLVCLINDQNQGSQPIDYGNIVKYLYRRAICKDFTRRGQDLSNSNSLRASICLQLEALGLTPDTQQQHQNIDINALVAKLEALENKFIYQKRIRFDPSKKLNNMKVDMTQLEWYKKQSKNLDIGYYDCFKNGFSPSDQDVSMYQKNLTNYWKDMVEEAEMKPQTEGATFRTRWLFGGTTYRRMVEPLDITEYYASGGTDYVAKGRSRHYQVLEEWLKEEKERRKKDEKKKEEKKKETTKKNVELILTIDSCFWAYVEEALLLCQQLENVQSSVKEKEEATMKLHEFEKYVYDSLKKYEVSPEIFLMKSSYMRWWNQYKEIKGISVKPELAVFMSNSQHYDQYTKGAYDFP